MVKALIHMIQSRSLKALLVAGVAAGASMISGAAQAAPINLSTGAATWNVSYNPGTGVVNEGTVVIPNGNFPIPPWLANDANSSWISPASYPGTNAPTVVYTYTTSFNLTDSGSLFSGKFLSDNEVTGITLTGNSVVPQTNGTANTFTDWTSLSSLVLGPGSYTLSVAVMNDVTTGPQNPTGFRFEGSVLTGAVPEPSSLVLSAIGVLMVGRLSWKRRLAHRGV